MGLIDELSAIANARVLELGARRSNPAVSTLHKKDFPHGEWVGTDIQPGLDVDVVADVHRLSRTLGEEQFDAVISFSTFEHIKYPVLAAHEIMKVLKIGGHLFIQTHFVYHEHAYPNDYYRYTKSGLAALFPPTMNFEVRSTDFVYPCEIRCDDPVIRDRGYLNVHLWGTKHGPTPPDFRWQLDDLI